MFALPKLPEPVVFVLREGFPTNLFPAMGSIIIATVTAKAVENSVADSRHRQTAFFSHLQLA